jgi:predicted metal-binding membrane protein
VLTIAQSRAMDDMTMGLGSIGPFVVGWAVMMAAMMLPSASPLVFEFARRAEGRRGWQAATALVEVTYLGVWLVFGVVCYALYNAVGMPWPNQSLVGGVALVVAGLYALTPLKRASEARCRELCALHGPLPFNLMRSAVVIGARYGLSCLGCSAGLMVAIVLIGMSNVIWMIVLAAIMLAYRVAPGGSRLRAVGDEAEPAPTPRWILALSAAVVALGVLYIAGA